MSRVNVRKARPAPQVRQDLIALLGDAADSASLRQALEELAREHAFSGLTHLWGPVLYARSPVFFRSFISAHFSSVAFEKEWKYRLVEWKGETGQRLDSWMTEVDRAGDAELYRRLYAWKLQSTYKNRGDKAWQKDLVVRFQAAPDRDARRLELSKHDLFYWLEEATAVTLYNIDPSISTPFILKHLPRPYSLFTGEKRVWWTELARLAQTNQDDALYFALYRKQAGIEQWRQDALQLCREVKDTATLLKELRLRHLDIWNKDLGSVYADLLAERGEDLFPYLLPELDRVLRGWFRDGFDRLIELAEKRGWMELWGALIRACALEKEFEKAVLASLSRPAPEAKQRLLLLSGAGLEWNLGGFGVARIMPLSDTAACAIYIKSPELLQGPLKAQLVPRDNEVYAKLTDQLLGQDDEELLDHLASRLLTVLGLTRRAKLNAAVERLASYFEALQRDPAEFSRRAGGVLNKVPAYTIFSYGTLIRENRLARLLFERSAKFYLSYPQALADLVEAPEIHVQALAYRTLGLQDPQACRMALEHLQILLGTLLRPLHRRTRLLAFRALENAAHDPEAARQVADRVRDALGLPDSHYPKDQLVGLLGRLLTRHPQLRTQQESPVVYRRVPCSESA